MKKSKKNEYWSGGAYISLLKYSVWRILRQIKKEFQLLKIDKMNLLIALALPPGIIMLFAFMSTSASTTIPVKVVVVSYDSNTFVNQNNYTETTTWDNFTEKYLDAVEESELLELIEFYDASEDEDEYAMETARNEMRDGNIECIIIIPVEFSELLSTGYPGIIEVIPDSSNAVYIQDRLNAVQDSIKIFVEDNDLDPEYVLEEYDEFSVPSNYNFRYNYNMNTLLPFMVFGISMVLTILVVVQEKPIPRLLLTPVKKSEILLSKFIVYSIVLALQVFLVLSVAISNGLYIAGSVLDLYIALYMLGFAGVSLGMFISTLSKTKTEANQLFFAFFIVIILLSGMFIPIDAMPDYLQIIAYMLPLSHGSPIIKGILSKGKPVIGFDFFWLLGISSFLIILSFIIINKKRYEV
ncbi:MAG: ABC transporter permease [Promethearchaeota archaeon]|nr:MAG: ABC transporter permease [Candidatus Lokiarchaeota archaeon]